MVRCLGKEEDSSFSEEKEAKRLYSWVVFGSCSTVERFLNT
jgi:hypothetical protein